MTSSRNHRVVNGVIVHKYYRVNLRAKDGSKYPVYRCAVPGCTTQLVPEQLRGRMTICWRCGDNTVVQGELRARPHCVKCTKTYNWKTERQQPVKVQAVLDHLDELLAVGKDDKK